MYRWNKRDRHYRKNLFIYEMNKLILKSLMANFNFNMNNKIYWTQIWVQYNKFSSISFYRRSCLITGFSRSVSRRFKLVRHFCKNYASNGLLMGLRKSSF
jgi:ribosomal protein S14